MTRLFKEINIVARTHANFCSLSESNLRYIFRMMIVSLTDEKK